MKFYLFIFALLLAVMAILGYVPPVRRQPPGGWKPFPTFPGQGPYNPKIRFPY
ncbi:abaecin-like [Temnothorax curvispinosus]|uniref:Abaecin-like n=2 Tax=Temnothorax TaxID=300110 RepID=A0A6J1PIS9_9HYME|nr:abaecin-like [Temnothorax curvispinosus]TGZ56531.1 Abaecin 1 [Temnothorax longispinosus]